MEESKPGLVDRLLDKAMSRKLLAFILASCFLATGNIDATNWTLFACIYVGAQGAIDFFKISRGINPS